MRTRNRSSLALCCAILMMPFGPGSRNARAELTLGGRLFVERGHLAPGASLALGLRSRAGLRLGAGIASLEVDGVHHGNDMVSSAHTLRYVAWLGKSQPLTEAWRRDWTLRAEYADLDGMADNEEVAHTGQFLALVGGLTFSRPSGIGRFGVGIGAGVQRWALSQDIRVGQLGSPFSVEFNETRFVAELSLGLEFDWKPRSRH